MGMMQAMASTFSSKDEDEESRWVLDMLSF